MLDALAARLAAIKPIIKQRLRDAPKPKRPPATAGIGLPSADNALARVVHQFKKYRKRGVTDICINRSNFAHILGYTVAELHAHLLTTATLDMHDTPTCELHIDHHLPAASFDLNDLHEVRQAYRLDNLRLMHALANAVKSRSDLDTIEMFR